MLIGSEVFSIVTYLLSENSDDGNSECCASALVTKTASLLKKRLLPQGLKAMALREFRNMTACMNSLKSFLCCSTMIHIFVLYHIKNPFMARVNSMIMRMIGRWFTFSIKLTSCYWLE